MVKTIKYSLVTCFIAYVMGAIALFIFNMSELGWSGIDKQGAGFIVNMLTLGFADYPGWGDLWYLAVLVPWLGSSLVLALFLTWRGKDKWRWLWGGLSVAIYYIVRLLVFAIGKLIVFWGNIDVHPGDFAYALLLIWPAGGFILGYLAATITDRIIKLPSKG